VKKSHLRRGGSLDGRDAGEKVDWKKGEGEDLTEIRGELLTTERLGGSFFILRSGGWRIHHYKIIYQGDRGKEVLLPANR